MRDDDLNRPLGQEPGRLSSAGPFRSRLVLAVAAVSAIAVVAAALTFADPHGGEPFAVAALPPPRAPQPITPPPSDPTPTASIRPPVASPPPLQTENGVTIFRAGQGQAAATGPLVIKVPQALGLSEVAPVDRRLVEGTRYGPLPKIAADGARASEVYARPPVFTGTIGAGTPRIAIVVTGLGRDAASTETAIRALPAAVSLAFSPYGEQLDAAATRAKAAGHEVLLQLAASAGDGAREPHALRAGATAAAVIDDLHWLMSRMSGYVGIGNFHGASLAADHAAMTTMLQELNGRGVLYVGDKQAASAEPSSAAVGLPAAGADFVLDASADAGQLRAATLQLEAAARAKGSAILAVDASPAALTTLAAFTQTLDAKGLALVPVSALAVIAAPALARTP